MAEPSAEGQVQRLTCTLCNLSYAPDKGRVHGRKFQCVPCASADRLLRRGLGDRTELQCLPVSEQHGHDQTQNVTTLN